MDRCDLCDREYDGPLVRICPRCSEDERREIAWSHSPLFFLDSRKERMRERLGVSGDVDE